MSETIDSTTKINIDTDGVGAVVAEVQKLYEVLQGKIEELDTKRDGISEYWTSVEASNFVEQMRKVSGHFNDFSKHYGIFIDSIKKILELYDEEEESIITAINAYKGQN